MVGVAAILPAVLGALWFLIHRHRRFFDIAELSRRGSLVIAFLVFQLFVATISELTSIGGHFNGRTVGLVWLSLLVVFLLMVRRQLEGDLEFRRRAVRLVTSVRAGTLEERLWAAAGLVWLVVLVAIAWLYRPSNNDALVYHLARVAHWVQDASVAHFPTHYLAQLEFAPLHEYNLAHLHLLSGGDRLDGYVQLVAAIVAIAGASEIARLLGGSQRAQLIAAVLGATVPSIVLEATSTQNNDFAAAIGIALLLLLLVWKPFVTRLPGVILTGGTVGAAVLSKGTLIAFFAPVCLVLAVSSVRSELRRRTPRTIALTLSVSTVAVLGAAVLIAGPFLLRNVQLFGGPTGPVSKSTISRELTVNAAAANVVRSTASNFAIGDGRDGLRTHVSRVVLGTAGRLFALLGVDPGDPRYALGTDLGAFEVRDYSTWERVEDVGANPWHVGLVVSAGGVLAAGVIRGKAEDRRLLLIAVALAAGYVLFTATARWSVFAVRYYIPLLIAWCPLVALVLVRLRPWLSSALLLLLTASCLPHLLDNPSRSVIHPTWRAESRLDPYFASPRPPGLAPSSAAYERLAAAIGEASCDRLGIASWVLLEYPIWVGVAHEGWSGRIQAVDVQNESRMLKVRDHNPCALVRQVEGRYITPDDGLANLRFGSLAFSARPELMTRVKADAPGFHSAVAGVDLRPGGGWLLGGQNPSVVGEATVHVTSDASQSVRIRFLGSAGDMRVRPVAPSGETLPAATASTAGGTDIDLVLPEGTTTLLVAASGPAHTTLEFDDVTVGALSDE